MGGSATKMVEQCTSKCYKSPYLSCVRNIGRRWWRFNEHVERVCACRWWCSASEWTNHWTLPNVTCAVSWQCCLRWRLLSHGCPHGRGDHRLLHTTHLRLHGATTHHRVHGAASHRRRLRHHGVTMESSTLITLRIQVSQHGPTDAPFAGLRLRLQGLHYRQQDAHEITNKSYHARGSGGGRDDAPVRFGRSAH